MSRPRDPAADDLDKSVAQRVPERALVWEMRCPACPVPWLARATEQKERRLRRMAARHAAGRPGHAARVEPAASAASEHLPTFRTTVAAGLPVPRPEPVPEPFENEEPPPSPEPQGPEWQPPRRVAYFTRRPRGAT